MPNKKLTLSIVIFSLLLFCTSVVKNKTNIIEKNILFYEKQIFALEREIYEKYRAKSVENWNVFLTPISSKGYWDKINPFDPIKKETVLEEKMLAALTRATIKPKIMLKFWSRVPAISKVIGNDKNVLFKMGLGEIPWFHQVTFSIWPNAESMSNFARKDGPHAKAIKSVREGNWFSEELYARFKVEKAIGKWCGKSVI